MREGRSRGQATAQRLRERILGLVRERDLRPGDRIPTEAELKLLEQDGVLHVTHGHNRTLPAAGALDVGRPVTRFESITEMGAALGMACDTRVLGLEEERPTPDLARALRLPAGEGVVRVEQLGLHGGEPMVHCVTRVRRSAIPRRPFELDGVVLATTPDLISALDADTGAAVTADSLRYGQRLVVVTCDCDPKWRTPEGIALVGPRYFRYDRDYAPRRRAGQTAERA